MDTGFDFLDFFRQGNGVWCIVAALQQGQGRTGFFHHGCLFVAGSFSQMAEPEKDSGFCIGFLFFRTRADYVDAIETGPFG